MSRLKSWVTGIKDFYNDINPATLSGAIDIIVVRQPDGSLKCSPFHVRFGKLYLLRPKEKMVHVTINDEPVKLNMKIGEAGEAFFFTEAEETVDPNCPSVGSMSPVSERKRLMSEASDAESTKSASESKPIPVPSSPGRKHTEIAAPDCELPPDQAKPSTRLDDVSGDIYEWRWGDFPSSDENLRQPDSQLAQSDVNRTQESGLLSRIGRAMFTGKQEQTVGNDGGVYLSDIEPTPAEEYLDAVSFHSTHEEDTELEHMNPLPESTEEAKPNSITVYRESSEGRPSDATSPDSECSVRSLGDDKGQKPLGLPQQALLQLPQAEQKAVESVSNSVGQLVVKMSLCGKKRDFNTSDGIAAFETALVTFDKFRQTPALLSDPSLIVFVNGKYFTWPEAAPIIMSNIVFQRDLDQLSVDKAVDDSRRSWFFSGFFSKATDKSATKSVGNTSPASSPAIINAPLVPTSVAPPVTTSQQPPQPAPPTYPAAPTASNVDERPQTRSLRLTSEQLQKLNLRDGANTATFTIISKMQGKHTVSCSVYLWNHDAKIVISDIDGTITRSDVMGHVAALLSQDWTHSGVAGLFSDIEKNGYKFVYLSSRSISHAGPTRGYLKGVLQKDSSKLPDGPVLLSPASLFQSIHREVIKRRPEEFKVACLRDIRRLFPKCQRDVCVCCCCAINWETPESLLPCTCMGPSPFTSGFGNRPTDELSYLAVGVPISRIFIIDPSSQIRLSSNGQFRSSYENLNQIVDQIFPPLSVSSETQIAYNDFTYWRDPLPMLNENELKSLQ